jgi:hypothetical protein
MSFSDPLSVTIGGVTTSLPQIGVGENRAEYRSGDGLITVSASHNYGKRVRRMLRLDTSKLAADVFRDDVNVEQSMSMYMVFDLPEYGYTPAEALSVYTGYKGLITANTDLLITKLLGGES